MTNSMVVERGDRVDGPKNMPCDGYMTAASISSTSSASTRASGSLPAGDAQRRGQLEELPGAHPYRGGHPILELPTAARTSPPT